MSSQYPLRSMKIHFYPEKPTYPKSLPYDMLKPYGYRVGLFGSHNDHWGRMSNYLASESVDIYSHVGSVKNDKAELGYESISVTPTVDGNSKVSFGNFMYQSAVDNVERLDEETADIALKWMQHSDTQAPFFMYLNLQAGHLPFDALPENYTRTFLTADNEMAQRMKDGQTIGVPLNYIHSAYFDAMRYVDSNIKRVVNQIKAEGNHENTIYIISSDTSIRLLGDVIGNGGGLFSEVLRIPMILSLIHI